MAVGPGPRRGSASRCRWPAPRVKRPTYDSRRLAARIVVSSAKAEPVAFPGEDEEAPDAELVPAPPARCWRRSPAAPRRAAPHREPVGVTDADAPKGICRVSDGRSRRKR
jgi:hypothetical protein